MQEDGARVLARLWKAMSSNDDAAVAALLAPGAELHPPPERVTSRRPVYRGADWFTYRDELEEATGSLSYEPDGPVVEVGDGVWLADMTVRGVGRGSGAPFEQRAAHVYELRDGRVERLRIFIDRDAARAAAGLRGP